MTRFMLSLKLVATLLVCAFTADPALAQRVFVAAQGTDANPCTFALPCRTFQHAHDTVSAGGEIDVLDPAGYGALTISKAVSIQGHGYSGITQAGNSASAITIQAGPADRVHLRGLLIEGAGTGLRGIEFDAGASLEVADCVVRNFGGDAIIIQPSAGTTNLLIKDVAASDNGITGINIHPQAGASVRGALDRVTVNHNGQDGVHLSTESTTGIIRLTISGSIISNNGGYGFSAIASTGTINATIEGSVTTNNINGVFAVSEGAATAIVVVQNTTSSNNVRYGVFASEANAMIRLSRSHLTGNDGAGWNVFGGGVVLSYGDNTIEDSPSGTGALPQASLK